MKKQARLFNNIAKIYGMFFHSQVRKYRKISEKVKADLDFSAYKSIIDIGCGTGALCRVLQELGLAVTGIDPAEDMLKVAVQKNEKMEKLEPEINFVQGDVLEGLDFADKSFDLAITAYVAHGMDSVERQLLYAEMKRVATNAVVILDYNEHRSVGSDIIEWAEGGDYFNFIKVIKEELMDRFGNLKVIKTGKRSALYISMLE